jgi:hypothetical protein
VIFGNAIQKFKKYWIQKILEWLILLLLLFRNSKNIGLTCNFVGMVDFIVIVIQKFKKY